MTIANLQRTGDFMFDKPYNGGRPRSNMLETLETQGEASPDLRQTCNENPWKTIV